MKINKKIIAAMLLCLIVVLSAGVIKVSAASPQITIGVSGVGGSVAPGGTYYNQDSGYFEVVAGASSGYKFAYWYTDPSRIGITVDDVETYRATAFIDGVNNGALYAVFVPSSDPIVIPDWVYQYETGALHGTTTTTTITTTTLSTTSTTTTTTTTVPVGGFEVRMAVNMFDVDGDILNFPPYPSALAYTDSKMKAELIGADGLVKETRYIYWIDDNGVNGYSSGSYSMQCHDGDVIRLTAMPTGLYEFRRWDKDDGLEYVGDAPGMVKPGVFVSTVIIRPVQDKQWIRANMRLSPNPSIYNVKVDWRYNNTDVLLGTPEITGGTLDVTGTGYNIYLVDADGVLTLNAPNNGDGYFERWCLEGSYELVSGAQAYIMENGKKLYYPDEYVSPQIVIKVKGELLILCDYDYRNHNQETYTWYIDMNGEGSIDVTLGNGSKRNYKKRTTLVTNNYEVVALKAIPAKGHEFVRWEELRSDGTVWSYFEGVNNIDVKSDVNVSGKTYKAYFSLIPVVTTTIATSTTTTVSPTTTVVPIDGDSVTVTLDADGYVKLVVTVPERLGGIWVRTLPEYQVGWRIDDFSDYCYAWYFIPYGVQSYGTNTRCEYVGKFEKGSVIYIKAPISYFQHDPGHDRVDYNFRHWQGDIGDYSYAKDNVIKLTMNKNRTIHANYATEEDVSVVDIADKIEGTLDSIGANNPVGYWVVTICGMVVLFYLNRDDERMRIIMPLMVLGLGLIMGWLSAPVIVAIAVIAAVGIGAFIKNKVLVGG